MKLSTERPKPREIAGTLRVIRSQWDREERNQRRNLARAKQRQLLRFLIAAPNRLGNAV